MRLKFFRESPEEKLGKRLLQLSKYYYAAIIAPKKGRITFSMNRNTLDKFLDELKGVECGVLMRGGLAFVQVDVEALMK